jgi:hypothetical protein
MFFGFLGARRMVDVIDVNTQQALELTLQNWVKYFTNPDRKLIYNVISLEFSHTKLQEIVESPSVVRFLYSISFVCYHSSLNITINLTTVNFISTCTSPGIIKS